MISFSNGWHLERGNKLFAFMAIPLKFAAVVSSILLAIRSGSENSLDISIILKDGQTQRV